MVQSIREDQRNNYLSSLTVLLSLYVYIPQRQQIPEKLSQPLRTVLGHTASPSALEKAISLPKSTNSADQCQFTNVNKFLKSLATTLALAKEVTMD